MGKETTQWRQPRSAEILKKIEVLIFFRFTRHSLNTKHHLNSKNKNTPEVIGSIMPALFLNFTVKKTELFYPHRDLYSPKHRRNLYVQIDTKIPSTR